MDIDYMKYASASEDDQMEMMFTQMDRLPHIFDDVNEFSSHQGCNTIDSTSTYDNETCVLENLQASSSTFMNLQHNHASSISFSEEAQPAAFPQQVNSIGAGRWKPDEFSEQAASEKRNSVAAMREMIFRIAAMQPIHIDPESVKPPKRRNVKLSTDPQSVAARHRRERISERIRILQRLVPGGTKMDTASMLDEAIHYVKFLKNQVQSLERVSVNGPPPSSGIGFPVPMSSGSFFPAAAKAYHQYSPHQADA